MTTEVSILLNNKDVIARGRVTDEFIHDVDVEPKYRRQGIATDIIGKLIGFGGKHLWVQKTNDSAVQLYSKLGFAVESEEEGYYRMTINSSKLP